MSVARMTLGIDRYESIAQLEQLNGVSIPEIERRARPGAYAASGFIGSDERFKDILQQDWKTVQALGTTHTELAAHLRTIWNEVFAAGGKTNIFYKLNRVPDSSLHGLQQTNFFVQHASKLFFALGTITVIGTLIAAYTVSSLFLFILIPASLFPIIGYNFSEAPTDPAKLGQNLAARIDRHSGLQRDLFARNEGEALQNGWNEQLVLTNTSSQQTVVVGRGVIETIEKYGFYEGGKDQNLYRIDPLKLVSILTGASVSSLQLRCKAVTA